MALSNTVCFQGEQRLIEQGCCNPLPTDRACCREMVDKAPPMIVPREDGSHQLFLLLSYEGVPMVVLEKRLQIGKRVRIANADMFS